MSFSNGDPHVRWRTLVDAKSEAILEILGRVIRTEGRFGVWVLDTEPRVELQQ